MALHIAAGRLGEFGEEEVATKLKSRGLFILDRNWRIREGEIDIVATDGQLIIFVEVKTRSSARYGDPLEAISPTKARRLQRLALAWLASNQRLGASYRIDVAGVTISRSGAVVIDHRESIL